MCHEGPPYVISTKSCFFIVLGEKLATDSRVGLESLTIVMNDCFKIKVCKKLVTTLVQQTEE